jgi:hypothetical protein
VVNYPWKEVQKLFQDRGFEVEFRKAGTCPYGRTGLQSRHTGTGCWQLALKSGQKVIFFLYEEVKAASRP